jgi:hypothetical protein
MVNDDGPAAPGPLSRWAAHIGVALIVLSLGGLAAIWTWDRTRAWETPRLDLTRFVRLVPPAAPPGPDSLAGADSSQHWLVPVNPACDHCRRLYPAVLARRDSLAPRATVEALIVDAAKRPESAALAPFRGAGVLWDSTGVWRHHWGHRVYGETLRFRTAGTLVSVDPPPAVP